MPRIAAKMYRYNPIKEERLARVLRLAAWPDGNVYEQELSTHTAISMLIEAGPRDIATIRDVFEEVSQEVPESGARKLHRIWMKAAEENVLFQQYRRPEPEKVVLEPEDILAPNMAFEAPQPYGRGDVLIRSTQKYLCWLASKGIRDMDSWVSFKRMVTRYGFHYVLDSDILPGVTFCEYFEED
jgi:hypothetical protein